MAVNVLIETGNEHYSCNKTLYLSTCNTLNVVLAVRIGVVCRKVYDISCFLYWVLGRMPETEKCCY